jgi:hypothetical protein
MGSDDVDTRKEAIQKCIKQYHLKSNPAIDDTLYRFEGTPSQPSKTLAVLILTYKREAVHTELRRISDQPAALIRTLRRLGFIFKNDGSHSHEFLYKNKKGQICRSITGFNLKIEEPSGRAKELLQKSVGACVSAIEIYNKPDFKYREETFSILLINAWELLFKAKLLFDNKNKLQSILDGKKKNRCGNPKTLDVSDVINKLGENNVTRECRINILSILEIRDNAVHFLNKDILFCKKVQEFGTASLRNYMIMIQKWFNYDLSKYNFFLMPLSFYVSESMTSMSIVKANTETKKLVEYLSAIERGYPSAPSNEFSISLNMTTKFTRATSDAALLVRYSDDPTAVNIKVTEEDELKRKYPLSYADLVGKMRIRYQNFKVNNVFYEYKKTLEDPEKYGVQYSRIRYLNPENNKSARMKFYSTEIFKEFDKQYTRQ